MASQQHDDRARRGNDASRFVYVPCPACGRGVQLSEENRLAEDDAYECPACGARLIVSDG